jgi:glutamate synthase domain-containing protein 2
MVTKKVEIMNMLITILILLLVLFIVYDRFIQRKHQLLINYPVIGRMRYFLEAVREPFRQYFADEDFYESRDKVDWVYNASKNIPNFASFSPAQPAPKPKFLLRHSNAPYNLDEMESTFGITVGERRKYPFVSRSVIGRAPMSDGAISPEGTWAFVQGAYDGGFPINTGEGSLTSNFFITHRDYSDTYMDIIEISAGRLKFYRLLTLLTNRNSALRWLKRQVLPKEDRETYLFDIEAERFYRPKWSAPLESFPNEVPKDMPDITFQISSGLFGVRDEEGAFDPLRYQKVMKFCKMCELKIAQGAKQTGGKLSGKKVTDAIAYYRGIKAGESVISPNRFPYGNSARELFDFIAQLQALADKPVGMKIVISDRANIEEFAKEMRRRLDEKEAGIPDFISIDGGDGGSATAPLALMERVGLHVKDALYLADEVLREYNVRDQVKIIASGKILTPDDVVITLALGADMVNIGRGFMMSAGCIRARMCSGAGSHQCPVGLATQDRKLRNAYLVYKNAAQVASYHNNLLEEIKTILAVMRVKSTLDLAKEHLMFIDKNGFIYEDVRRYYNKKLHLNG